MMPFDDCAEDAKISHPDQNSGVILKNKPPEKRLKSPKRLYPSLKIFHSEINHSDDDGLTPEEEAGLEDEAAKYHNPDWPPLSQRPPPYNLPPFVGPTLSQPRIAPPVPEAFASQQILDEPLPSKRELISQIKKLREAIQLKKEHNELVKELRMLDLELTDPPSSPEPPPAPVLHKTSKIPKRPHPQRLDLFPVTETFVKLGDEDEEEPVRNSARLGFKTLKELKAAVTQYGPVAPFTLSILDTLGDLWLTPNDWFHLARATLSGGDFVLWKSEFSKNCKETARRNLEACGEGAAWTLDMLKGAKPYDTNEAQKNYAPGLFAQIQNAGLKAWRKLPQKGAPTTSLANIRQGPDEPYSDFISRLTSAAERLLGEAETDTDFITHLAFENANPACKAAIRPHRRGKRLSDYIRYCAGIGSAYNIGIAIGAALKDFSQGFSNKKCFKCGQEGHFAKDCAKNGGPPKQSRPSNLCPRCKRGKHWANECRSKTDAQGNPLPSTQGNFLRGQPQAPKTRRTAHSKASTYTLE
ncbi:endogenous retrovirus group K member 10 Gag polyprotein-like [Erinaceus europaeus]|uniref:Endogenous retrovirus group K member 10 Gag polyprotein-like n=1 Tax=Erinaceus europaeus TaxID=9365 RepID=A0ABM3X8Q6_ERIEU|nr:endogenous retrovirus group K member 10 Gag polyprotein-like [Erinaceus europaeus]